MLFTFKRDDRGHEFVMVDTRIVWQCYADMRMNTGWGRNLDGDVTPEMLGRAIKAAEADGFWLAEFSSLWAHNEVTVEVQEACNVILTVETEGGDEA